MPSTPIPDARPALWSSPRSLAARLTLWYSVSSFAVILIATTVLYWTLAEGLAQEHQEILADQIHVVRTLLRDHTEPQRFVQQEVEWEAGARQHDLIYLRVTDEKGGVVSETPEIARRVPPDAFSAPVAADAGPTEWKVVRGADGSVFRTAAALARSATAGRGPYVIQAAIDCTHEERFLAGFRQRALLALALASAACAFAGYRIARRGTRPLREIAQTVQRIHLSTLGERIELGPLPSELATLAATFNDMLERLEQSFARLSQFCADIAHELRTPVNNLRGEMEVALGRSRTPAEYAELLASALEECSRLSRIIDSLLFLARAERPACEIQREPLDVAREIEALREFYEPQASEAGVTLATDVVKGLGGQLDRTLLQRAIGNLVENALRHTPPGGDVRLRAREEGEQLVIEVADSGCGIEPEHLPRVFDRFYRVDGSRNAATGGNGLGLAIVKTVAELHGGRAEIASAPGRGTCVRLRLPKLDRQEPRS